MKGRILIAGGLATLAVAGAIALLRPSAIALRTDSAAPSQRATEALKRPPPLAPASPAGDAVVPGEQDCLTALAAPASNSHLLLQERERRIDSYLEQQGDDLAQALAADLAGVREQPPLADGQFFSGDQVIRYATPATGERRLSREEQQRLTALLAAEGVAGLVALDDETLFAASWGRGTTTTGHLIRQYAAGHQPGLLAFASSLSIGYHELATAMEAGVSPRDFSVLLDAADVDLAGTWLMGANLAKVAAIRTRPAILALLRARGIDPAAPHRLGHPSVLDDIAARDKPADAEGARRLAEVVRQLVAAGDRPYLPSTLSTLARWLPETRLPVLHPDSAARLSTLADAANALAELDAEWASRIAAAKRLEEGCEARLEADPEAALGAFAATDLVSKLRYQEALAARREREVEELNRAAEAADFRAGGWTLSRREVDEMFSALKDGRWQAMLALADRGGGAAHSMLLPLALRSGAPRDVLLALAQRTEKSALPPAVMRHAPDWFLRDRLQDGVLQLAIFPRADIAAIVDALEPIGLDLHYVDARGRNAFTILAYYIQDHNDEARSRFAELLASRSVSVKPRAYGLDPLDTVLMRLVEFPWSARKAEIRFARFLIDHGAPIEQSHLQLARQLAAANAAVYRRLMSAVPELAR